MDPTHFSAVRHHYQQTAESLLDDRAVVTFPEINKKDLQAFRDTYGASAFVCRYLHCVFSTDGFESSSHRAKHESQHQRRYCCAHSSCVYFTTGFATGNLLKRHNEKYHPAIAKGPSLADIIAPPSGANNHALPDYQMQQKLLDQQTRERLMMARQEQENRDQNDGAIANYYNPSEMGPNGTQSGPGGGNHALQEYQMQYMLLEKQKKKRLMMARQEEDDMARQKQDNTIANYYNPSVIGPNGIRGEAGGGNHSLQQAQ